MPIRRGALTKDIGASGLENSRWGYSQEDFLQAWRGRQKVKTIQEMISNSPVLGALRLSFEMPIRDIDWFFTGPEEADEDTDPGLILLNESLEGMSRSWKEHIIESMLFPLYGWAMFTITYKRDGGHWHWKKFKMLGHDTVHKWLYEDDGGLAGLEQLPHLWPEPIPIERMIIYRFRTAKDDPEGESILRPAYKPYYYVKAIQTFEGIGIERNLAGFPMLTPPQGADMDEGSEDREAAEKLLRNVRQDEQAGILLPAPKGSDDHQQWHFELLAGSGGSGMTRIIDTNMVISRYEKRMLMSALSQFLFLGMDNVGALASFEGATDFHVMALNAVADIMAETFTKYAIPRLFALNGLDPAGYKIQHSPAGDIDLEIYAGVLSKIGSMLTWTVEDEIQLRSILRLPEKDVEELEALRDEERERQMEERAMFQPQQEQMGADYYGLADTDDPERNRLERQLYRKAVSYFNGAMKRTVGEVKRENP